MTKNFKEEMAEKISELIDYRLGAEHIHAIKADGSGYYYYIQALRDGYPLLAMHYRGPLMLVLPYADYQRLENGEVSVDSYIDESHWNYGYYWGGGSPIGGAYWQPLEETTGIHEKEKISRYLRILSCRTMRRASGYNPSPENCAACQLIETGCPLSPCNQTGNWENEVEEVDYRLKLIDAVAQRIRDELGFEPVSWRAHLGERKSLKLSPGFLPNEVQISLPAEILNNLLDQPGERDWEELAQNFEIILSRVCSESSVILPKDNLHPREVCLDYWGDEMQTEAHEPKKFSTFGVSNPSADLRGLEKFTRGGIFARSGLFRHRSGKK